jgi:Uma2 family endonuclease
MTTEINFEQIYTVDQFLNLPEGDKRYELIKGELREMPGPSIEHGLIISRLFRQLDRFLSEQPLGQVVNNLAFVLNPKNAPLPDLAFILAERLKGKDFSDAFPGPPDLAIEVISRTDFVFKVDDKIDEYLKAGVRLVWVINPRKKIVELYRPATGLVPQIISTSGELDGEDLIPGFRMKVAILFDESGEK